jgi:hypothetical protein
VFIGASVGVLLASLIKGRIAFVHPKAFPELAGKSKEEQERLLQAANEQAFGLWKYVLATLPLPFSMACGVALGKALSSLAGIPVPWWGGPYRRVVCLSWIHVGPQDFRVLFETVFEVRPCEPSAKRVLGL